MLFGKDLYQQIPLGDFPAPALPSLSPQVFQAAFIHSSKNVAVPRSRFSFSEDFVDNERLEFLGDALLYAIVANYLYRTYPKLRVGYLSAIRQRLVQNTTLAKFGRMYKMDQALEMSQEAERLRNDTKTNADTFEAFVGAVAQVHGHEVLTKWIEDLIRPYATQMYEHHARTYGELEEPEPTPSMNGEEVELKKHRYRLCGFIPLPFLFRSPETKTISGSSSSSHNYGTLVSVIQVANGYTRLPEASSSHQQDHQGAKAPVASAMKKTKSHDGPTGNAAIKRSKSRERVAFTPPAVSNLERMQVAKPNKNSSLSDGEQPRNAAGFGTPKHQRTQSVVKTQAPVPGHGDHTPVKVQAHPKVQEAPAPTANNNVTTASGWTVPSTSAVDATAAATKNWQFAWSATGAAASKTLPFQPATPAATPKAAAPPAATSKPSAAETSGKTILKRDAPVAASSLSSAATPVAVSGPSGANTPSTNGTGQSQKITLDAATSTYLAALQSARSDPVAFLERHPMFHGKKAKKLEYDDVGSTAVRAVVRVKIDGKLVTQSAATGTDGKLAKARAAFKAIETLLLLPEAPPELSGASGLVQPKASTSNGISETPTVKRTNSTPVVLETPSKSATNGVPKAIVQSSTPAQLKKQAALFSTHPGPLPASFYASLPTAGKESDNIRYYITSVKGFSSGTYYAIVNSDLQLIGQSHSTKKATAIEEAEKMASEGKTQSNLKWQFEDRTVGSGAIKKVNLNIKGDKKESTGPGPILTHALAVSENEKARLSWLEWYSEDKKAWKCAVLVDAVFYGSAKDGERKVAVSLASTKALELLESQQK